MSVENNTSDNNIQDQQSEQTEGKPIVQERRRQNNFDLPAIHKKSKIKKIVAVLAILLMLGLVVFWFLYKPKPETDTNIESSDSTVQQEPVESIEIISEKTETYSSQQFYLEISHPLGWTVEDTKGTGLLTIESPQLVVNDAQGKTSIMKVVLKMRNSKQKLNEFDDGNATAVIKSEKIKYINPTSAQRGETYLSFLSYANSTSSSLIDGVFITGDFGYQPGQAIPKVDVINIDPITTVSFYNCDGTCDIPVGITADLWKRNDFGGQITNMFKSLRIN